MSTEEVGTYTGQATADSHVHVTRRQSTQSTIINLGTPGPLPGRFHNQISCGLGCSPLLAAASACSASREITVYRVPRPSGSLCKCPAARVPLNPTRLPKASIRSVSRVINTVRFTGSIDLLAVPCRAMPYCTSSIRKQSRRAKVRNRSRAVSEVRYKYCCIRCMERQRYKFAERSRPASFALVQ
jgi:hypothetical protein